MEKIQKVELEKELGNDEDSLTGLALSQGISNFKKIKTMEAKKELRNGEILGQDYNDQDGHEGPSIILTRKNTPKRRKEEKVKKPKLTASKKFNQLIVKSPLASDEREEDDVQMSEGETMTFFLK